jgi:hypothetical protein
VRVVERIQHIDCGSTLGLLVVGGGCPVDVRGQVTVVNRSEARATAEMAGPTACGKRWADILSSFERNLGDLVTLHPACVEEIRLIQAGLITIGQLINDSPRANGNSTAWKEITTRAEAERAVLCKHLEGKALFAAILRLYATTHTELRGALLPLQEQVEPTEEFREQRRRKRNPSDEHTTAPKKA